MADVIVEGSNYSTALGVVRAVGMAGYGVRLLATAKECSDIIKGSRYIVQCSTCDLEINEIRRALEELRGTDLKIPIIPTNDSGVAFFDEHFEDFSEHFSFPNINGTPGALSAFMDKLVQKKAAAACGLHVAEGDAYSADEAGINQAISQAVYPCVTKAISGVDCIGEKDVFSICRNQDELRAAMQFACGKNCSVVLVEQFLEVEKEYAVYGLAYNGKVAMPACLYTWRSGHGAHKGVTAEGIMLSSDFLGEDKEKIEEFVRKSGLNGLFCIDLILSKGNYYFIELNLRYGASGYAVTMGGANLPGMFARVLTEGGEIDEKIQLQSELRFLSEKVELDDYRVGYLSWNEYREHQKGEKLRLMKSDDDPEPWRQFLRLETRKRAARLLKGKKRRK